MQTFKGFVLSTFLLLLGIISLGEASAQFHYNDGQQQGSNSFEISVDVSQYVEGQRIFSIDQLLGQQQSVQGLKFVKLELFAFASSNYANAQILVNGQAASQAQSISWSSYSPITFQAQGQSQIFGQNLNSLLLMTNGNAYLERVVVTVAVPNAGPGPGQPGGAQTLRAQLNQDFYDSISLKQVFQLNGAYNPHMGKTVKSVILKGYPKGTRAETIKLKVGNRTVGAPQVLDRQGTQEVRFILSLQDQAVIDAYSDIELIFMGRVFAEEVIMEVEQAQRQFRMPLNRTIGSGRIFLNQFSELYSIDSNMSFEKITIRGRLLSSNGSIRACAHSSASGAFCESSNSSSGHFELVLQNFPVKIGDTFVMPRGQVVIDEIILLEEKKAPHQYPF